MEQLWAPWRLAYVVKDSPAKTDGQCFICRGLSEDDDRKNLIIRRSELGVVIANRFPYNSGHLLICPRAHRAELHELTTDELLDTQYLLRDMIAALKATLKPDGFNVGLNLGRAAGAGLPGHLHWHIVPRWIGDTNFMPLFSDTQVLVQSLDALYDLLTAQV